jgi:predicted RecB family nuclease
MRLGVTGQIRLSASDLMQFQSCTHATRLDLDYLKNPSSLAPAPDTEDAQMMQAHGIAHEEAFLATLRTGKQSVTEIAKDSNFNVSVNATVTAMKAASDYIYQGALGGSPWGGYADFLFKTPIPSALGAYSYEVADTKLARSVNPKHILQLVLYSDLLETIQGTAPLFAHLVLDDGKHEAIRLNDYKFYARHAGKRLESFVQSPWPTRPEPVSACPLCRSREHCHGEWEKTDSLTLVAGITKGQRRKLEAAGIRTLTALSQASSEVPRLPAATLGKLRTQSALQATRRSGGPFLRSEADRGRAGSDPDAGTLRGGYILRHGGRSPLRGRARISLRHPRPQRRRNLLQGFLGT